MQILCDSPSIQKLLDTQAELTRLITGYVERLSDYDGYELGQLVQFVVMARSDTVIEMEALGQCHQLWKLSINII